MAYTMKVWSPADRDRLIDDAKRSEELGGRRDRYRFKVYVRKDDASQEEKQRELLHAQVQGSLTEILAKVVYTKNPKYKYLSLGFYYTLIEKIRSSRRIGHMLWKDIVVPIKGANAYAYLTNDVENFPYSDLDITVYINPNMPDELFEMVREQVRILARQAVSQHKRMLHKMFFVDDDEFKRSQMYKQTALLDEETISQFKADYNVAIAAFNESNAHGVRVVSPFEDKEARDRCSRNSIVLTKSIVHENAVVKIEVPHFHMCETIPLNRSPFFASDNDSIDFKRDGQSLDGRFDLTRIRFGASVVFPQAEASETDESSEAPSGDKEWFESMAADFIDLSVPCKGDAELHDFWNTARMETILDRDVSEWRVQRGCSYESINCWLVVPSVSTCISDLYKMLHVYECPENKRVKREARYSALKKIAERLLC